MKMIHFQVLLLLIATTTITSKAEENAVRRIDGYKGIWFTLGQYYGKGSNGQAYAPRSNKPTFPYGDKYSGGLGTYTAKHTPLAIHCPEVNKTFFVYGGTTGPDKRHLLCMISFYDHARNRVPKPVVVHDKNGVNDPHDNPSLAIDDHGHLWVFVSGRARARPGFKYRSLKPYNIDGFEEVRQEELTYPQPHHTAGTGFLHLFTKYTGVRELYWETSGDGRSWSEDHKLAGIREPGDQRGGHYQTSASRNGRTGTFFNRHPNGNVDQRSDVYYVETRDHGKTWQSIDGQTLPTPLTQVDNPARVIDYARQGLNVYLKDMDFDATGKPVLLYVTSPGHEPGPPNDPRHFRVTRWDGSQWRTVVLCTTDHNYDMGSLYLLEDRWQAWIPNAPGLQPHHGGGEVVVWTSSNRGASWMETRKVTTASRLNHNYVRRPLAAKDPFFAFWADGDPTQLTPSHLYFSNSDGDKVWQLPYEMKEDWAEPIVVEPFGQ